MEASSFQPMPDPYEDAARRADHERLRKVADDLAEALFRLHHLGDSEMADQALAAWAELQGRPDWAAKVARFRSALMARRAELFGGGG